MSVGLAYRAKKYVDRMIILVNVIRTFPFEPHNYPLHIKLEELRRITTCQYGGPDRFFDTPTHMWRVGLFCPNYKYSIIN